MERWREYTRTSKNKVINREGKELIDLLEDKEWKIENGGRWGDEERE